ncbi:MAG: A/G-specific adenine glycosylase [Phototrophicaceae bacterium]
MTLSLKATEILPPLLAWYDANKADLPWRGAPAYPVWLSEIMLQQTQIDTVIPYYKRFLETYPTIHDLAQADLDKVLKLWEGLGYYSRARNLHKTAKIVSIELKGEFPSDVPNLLKLPGIGRYTAGAIASIAFDTQAPVLDGNVIRVFSRWLDLSDDVSQTSTKNYLWDVADELVPAERTGDYNQALMELGQKICTPRNPLCEQCPVQGICSAYANGTQAERPVKKKKPKTPHYDVSAGIIRNQEGLFLIAQRPMDGLLGGLWEFAGGKQEQGETMQECLKRELKEELAIEVEVGALFIKVKHAFTHFKITLHAYDCEYIGSSDGSDAPQAIEARDWAWVTQDELENYSFGKADRQVIQALKDRKNMLL